MRRTEFAHHRGWKHWTWVGVRSSWTRLATLTPLSAAERWPSTTRIPTLQWAPQRSCSTPPATENTAVGTDALVFNDTAEQNTATGAFALFSHVSGNGNTAIGADALFSDATGQANTAVGAAALSSNTSADNTAVGNTALFQ